MSAHGEFGSTISYPLRHILLFLLFAYARDSSLRIYRSSFLFALHCIIALYLWFHSTHTILVFYIRDTRWPTPPASGGMGSSPLRSETNAAYLGFSESVVSSQASAGHGNKTCFTDILLKRAISSAGTDGLVFSSTRRKCSSRISCYSRKRKDMKKEKEKEKKKGKEGICKVLLYYIT